MDWDDAILTFLLTVVLVWGVRILWMAGNPRANWPEVLNLWRDVCPRRKR